MTTNTRSLPAPLTWTKHGRENPCYVSTFYSLDDRARAFNQLVVCVMVSPSHQRQNSWDVQVFTYDRPSNDPQATATIVAENRRPRVGLNNAKSDGVDMLLDWLADTGVEAVGEEL